MVAGAKISFLFKAEKYSTVCADRVLFMHLSVEGPLGWFHPLATVNDAAMNMGV